MAFDGSADSGGQARDPALEGTPGVIMISCGDGIQKVPLRTELAGRLRFRLADRVQIRPGRQIALDRAVLLLHRANVSSSVR